MKLHSNNRGYSLVELAFASAMISVVGLVLYSLLNLSTILGAKNTAVNTAHEQARTAMVQMLQDLHSAISLPYLVDTSGTPVAGAGPAAGISFQEWSSGPHAFKKDASTGQSQINLRLTSNVGPTPVVGQHLVIPSHQIEGDITAVSGPSNNFTVTLGNIYGPALTAQECAAAGFTFPLTYPVSTLPVAVKGTKNYSIVCFVTDRCSYTVANSGLDWVGPSTRKSFSVMGADITSPTPFSTPLTPAGALYYRFVAAINLSTSDLKYNNRGFKSANIFLNGQVPMKAQLTTFQ